MSASGIDKSNIREIGRDVLLVSGFDPTRPAIRVSVPPHVEAPRRVSVDAIEHWMIYRRHPQIGAIVHVHAWMDGVRSTEIGYPCGTIELARSVAELVAAAPEPARSVIGQKNHGLTITGPDLHDIFLRIEGRLQTAVPMAA
jgi:ribulose-5-phosphate 4-epimerase/fuculose-1-phosphate aldolase